MKIAILGYGAVGKSLEKILKNKNNDIFIVSSEEYISKSNNKTDSKLISLSESESIKNKEWDVVILSTRTSKIESYYEIIENNIYNESIILPIQNGFTSFNSMQSKFKDRVLASSISIVAKNITDSEAINYTEKPIFYVGEPTNSGQKNKLNIFIDQYRNELTFEIINSSQELLWRKFTRITTLSSSCIYFENNLGQILQDKEKYSFLVNTLKSITDLALMYNIKIDIDKELEFINNIPKNTRTSLYESLERGERGEFDYLIIEALNRAKEKNFELLNIELVINKIYQKYHWLVSL